MSRGSRTRRLVSGVVHTSRAGNRAPRNPSARRRWQSARAGAGNPGGTPPPALRGPASVCNPVNPNNRALDHPRRPNAHSSRYGTDSRTLESAASSSARLSGRASPR
jgi:hypothetical protein